MLGETPKTLSLLPSPTVTQHRPGRTRLSQPTSEKWHCFLPNVHSDHLCGSAIRVIRLKDEGRLSCDKDRCATLDAVICPLSPPIPHKAAEKYEMNQKKVVAGVQHIRLASRVFGIDLHSTLPSSLQSFNHAFACQEPTARMGC